MVSVSPDVDREGRTYRAAYFGNPRGEVAAQIRRTLKTGGRSVPAHARTIVTEDLSTLEDLVARLLADEEYPSLTEGLRALSGPLKAYLGLKRRLPDGSYWYPRQAVRLQANPMYDRPAPTA